MKVAFTPRARRERRDAEIYYADASPTARERFRQELEAAIEFIRTYLNGAQLIGTITRAKTLRRFPYSILYIVDGDVLVVTAIANHYRDPARYADRIR